MQVESRVTISVPPEKIFEIYADVYNVSAISTAP